MIDLDFEGSKDAPDSEWAREMSALLVRTRMIATALLEADREQYWRASLSGHKGVHLYVDFEALDREIGTANQFRNGVAEYTNDFLETLKDETGLTNLDDYIDVVSGRDFARLTRLPNTIHDGATERFGETRFCVPVTIEELAQITPKEYINLTRRPRPIPDGCKRVTSKNARRLLTRAIRVAPDTGRVPVVTNSAGSKDTGRVKTYQEETVNDAMDLDRLKIHLRPFTWDFREREDMFSHGHESHIMEINSNSAEFVRTHFDTTKTSHI
ncbi:hypothetical protein RH858_04765 [Halalkaliarchaeum sp. AArc-GB]|uniref:hypothetical protein n=1 Tax=Halalkaliarchaeum sp. AArc-GB TaxID=3074078 RepID=UPI00285C20EF|nr:hypothetical protein [Halalkaliarchaeum sp. AArc-GB]MDR5672461.1 hypothetical protein [Halalkaliarchaeum sp. AArc-GB]